MQSFTTAGVNDVWIRWRDRNRANRRRRLIIENRLPRPTVIDRFKNAAVHRRHIKDIRLRWNSCDRARPPAAVRSNVSPANRIELAGAYVRLPKFQNNREDENDRTVAASADRGLACTPRCSGGRVGRNAPTFGTHESAATVFCEPETRNAVSPLLLVRGEDEGEESHKSATRTCVPRPNSELSVGRSTFASF